MGLSKYKCREVGLRLQTYLDGELDEKRAAAIRAHLDDCVDCGLEAEVFQQIKTELSQIEPRVDEAALQRLRNFSAQIVTVDRQDGSPDR